jgi:hypothetical protein
MTLHIYNELEQGSPEWLAARCGLVTASVVGKLITPTLKVADNDTSRGLTETLVAERITGFVEYVHPSFDMERGTLDEPYARELYAEQYAEVTEVGFMTNHVDGILAGYSPDGLVGGDGLLEIKSRKPRVQLNTILTDTVPRENMGQLQMGLLISGRDWIDYCSYAGGWPIHVIRVYPDPAWQTVIYDALATFEENAARMIDTYKTVTNCAPIAPRVDHFAEMEIA